MSSTKCVSVNKPCELPGLMAQTLKEQGRYPHDVNSDTIVGISNINLPENESRIILQNGMSYPFEKGMVIF